MEYFLYGEAIVWLLPSLTSDSGFEMRIIPSDWVVERTCETNYAVKTYKVRTQTGGTIEIDSKYIIAFRKYAPGSPASYHPAGCSFR